MCYSVLEFQGRTWGRSWTDGYEGCTEKYWWLDKTPKLTFGAVAQIWEVSEGEQDEPEHDIEGAAWVQNRHWYEECNSEPPSLGGIASKNKISVTKTLKMHLATYESMQSNIIINSQSQKSAGSQQLQQKSIISSKVLFNQNLYAWYKIKLQLRAPLSDL